MYNILNVACNERLTETQCVGDLCGWCPYTNLTQNNGYCVDIQCYDNYSTNFLGHCNQSMIVSESGIESQCSFLPNFIIILFLSVWGMSLGGFGTFAFLSALFPRLHLLNIRKIIGSAIIGIGMAVLTALSYKNYDLRLPALICTGCILIIGVLAVIIRQCCFKYVDLGRQLSDNSYMGYTNF